MNLPSILFCCATCMCAPLANAKSTPKATPTPSDPAAATIIDANGTFVGSITGLGWGNIAQLVGRDLNGTFVGLPATQEGFVDNAKVRIPGGLLLVYESSDCSGQPFIPLGTVFDQQTGQPVSWTPIVQSTTNNGTLGAYIFDGIAYFAGAPVASIIEQSQRVFVDPVNDTPQCQAVQPSAEIGGPVSQSDLQTLNLIPPFKAK